jgi:hypothetical protein
MVSFLFDLHHFGSPIGIINVSVLSLWRLNRGTVWRNVTPYGLLGTYVRPSSRHERPKVPLSCKVRRPPEL